MENMEYYTRRLQCSDAEKDACLETVAKLCHARFYLRRYGWLAAEDLAKKESDPFFRACLMDVTEGYEPESLERRYTQYLLAADCRGGAFLNALLISQGLVLLVRYENGEDFGGMSWEYVFTGNGGHRRGVPEGTAKTGRPVPRPGVRRADKAVSRPAGLAGPERPCPDPVPGAEAGGHGGERVPDGGR